MRTQVTFFLLGLLFFPLVESCISEKKTGKDVKNDRNFWGIGMLLDAYFSDNLEYPATFNDFLQYASQLNEYKTFSRLINKMKNERDKFTIKQNNKRIAIYYLDKKIYEEWKKMPCKELSYDKGYYLSNIILINDSNKTLGNDSLIIMFKKAVANIKKHYKHVDSKNIKIIVYEYPDTIKNYCRRKEHLLKYKYYKELKEFFKSFSEKYHLKKIIYTTFYFY